MDKNKICDNCGKCLGEEDYEVRAIKVDEILEDEEFIDDSTLVESEAPEEEGDSVEFIDDIEGLRELLDNKEHMEKYTVEEFPGFIRFKSDKEP